MGLAYSMMYFFVYSILVRFIKYVFIGKIKGLNNVPKKGPYIVVANHTSALDTAVIPTFFLRFNLHVHYLGKKELFKKWFSRTFHNVSCTIPIDRQAGGKQALKHAISALEKGKVIGMFPEGTRSRTGKLQRGKTGAARLALWTKVPIIPIGVVGAYSIWPKGQLMPKIGKKVKLNIGKPLNFKRYYGKEDKKTFRKITTIIMKEIAVLSNQKYEYN